MEGMQYAFNVLLRFMIFPNALGSKIFFPVFAHELNLESSHSKSKRQTAFVHSIYVQSILT